MSSILEQLLGSQGRMRSERELKQNTGAVTLQVHNMSYGIIYHYGKVLTWALTQGETKHWSLVQTQTARQ
jgi:hypothetical protein